MGGRRRLMRKPQTCLFDPDRQARKALDQSRGSAPARPSKHSTISKAPASGAAGTRQRGYACKPFQRMAKPEPIQRVGCGFQTRSKQWEMHSEKT